MRKKRTFSFYSGSCPDDFLARVCEVAKQAHLELVTSESELRLHIDSNHGGNHYYCAKVTEGDDGGTVLEGEIITIPWNESKRKTKFQKTMEVVGYILGGIVLSPVILLVFLCLGIYELFLFVKHRGKTSVARPRHEETLLDFMQNKLCCKQL